MKLHEEPESNTAHDEYSNTLYSQTRHAFTIVELLIVVVVIAILAAITIVAYNGVTQRAKASAAIVAAQGAAKKTELYATINGVYPTSLAEAEVTASGSASYQYRADNSGSTKTYCITATSNGVSYYINNTTRTTPGPGACAGHGADGAATITNLATDPRAIDINNVDVLGWRTGRWFGSAPAAGTYTAVTGASDGPAGISTYIRKQWTVIPPSTSGDSGFENSNTPIATAFPVVSGVEYNFSCYIRASRDRSFNMGVYQYTSAGVAHSTTRAYGPTTPGAAGQWVRPSYTYSPPAGVASIRLVCDTSGGTNWIVGSTLDGTGLMVTEGPNLYPYSDGNSPGWIWNGVLGRSTSTGPAL